MQPCALCRSSFIVANQQQLSTLLISPSPTARRYHIYIFVVECLGITAVLPYALLQVSSTRPTGSPGLPPDDGISIGDKIFNINVLVPCYSESLEVRGPVL